MSPGARFLNAAAHFREAILRWAVTWVSSVRPVGSRRVIGPFGSELGAGMYLFLIAPAVRVIWQADESLIGAGVLAGVWAGV